jgi:uncharacterized protein (TIGR03437 family)
VPSSILRIYSAILGGAENDKGWAIAVDKDANAYVTGYTESINYPTLNPFQPYHNNRDAFVTKLGPDGELKYSTFLGGAQPQPCGCKANDDGVAGAMYIFDQDGSDNSAGAPAAPGSVIVLYGTGEGQTTPAGVDGKPSPADFNALPRPFLPSRATIGGLPAQILYAGAVPYVVAGEFQMNVVVPAGLLPGDHEVMVWFGGQGSQSGITVRVQ